MKRDQVGRALWALVLALLAGCHEGEAMMAGRMQELKPRRVAEEESAERGLPPAVLARGAHDLSYWDRLQELRGHFDLQPWVEPVMSGVPGDTGPAGVVFPGGSIANDAKQGLRSRSYAMLAEDLLSFTTRAESGPPGNLAAIQVNLSEFQGARPEHQPPFIKDNLLLGSLGNGLFRYRNGLYLPSDVSQTIQVQLRSNIAAGTTGTAYLVYRGYRPYEKGSQHPIQFTYEEYAARGYTLESYPQSVTLTLPATPSVAEAPTVDLTFPANMVIDHVVGETGNVWLGFADPPSTNANILVKIEPQEGGPWMGGWCSLPAVGYVREETTLRWPIPFTVAKDHSWRFRVRKAFDDNAAATTVTFTLHGSILIPPTR